MVNTETVLVQTFVSKCLHQKHLYIFSLNVSITDETYAALSFWKILYSLPIIYLTVQAPSLKVDLHLEFFVFPFSAMLLGFH